MCKRIFSCAVIALIIVSQAVIAQEAQPANTLIFEYKTAGTTEKISVYGYLKWYGLVVDAVELSTNCPYLLAGHQRDIGPVNLEVVAGPVFDQTRGKIKAWATDWTVSGWPIKDYCKLLGVLELGRARHNHDRDWLFSKIVASYQNFGTLTTIFKENSKEEPAVVTFGPYVTWDWGVYGKFIITWSHDFTYKPGDFKKGDKISSLCFKYTKKINF